MAWNPELYLKYRDQRFAPFIDLLELVEVRHNISVIDLGCGTGELTKIISEQLTGSEVVGIDSSPEMLDKAIPKAKPGLGFELGDITKVMGKWDLVISNAALQWIEDHSELVPKLLDMVRPGGQLAVQLPSNHNHPTQTLMAEVATERPFYEALSGWSRVSPVLSTERYAQVLYDNGALEIKVFEKVYPHVLDSIDAIVGWVSGTAMMPYIERLPIELHDEFVKVYKRKLSHRYPRRPVFYPFKRTFFSARVAE